MLIEEQHVRVELGFQKIASHQFDNIQEEEIDAALNIAQERFIKQRMRPRAVGQPGFADNQRRMDDLREILVKNKTLSTFILERSMVNYEKNAVYAELPGNYLYLVSDRSNVVSTLDSKCLHRPEAKTVKIDVVKAIVPFPLSSKKNCPFYRDLKITLQVLDGSSSDSITLYDVSKSGYVEGVDDIHERFELVNSILDSIKRNYPELSFYWERYHDSFKPNSFIVVGENNKNTVLVGLDLQVDGVANSGVFVTGETRSKYIIEDVWESDYRANRLTDPEDLYSLLNHPFGKTRRNSPLSVLSENRLYLYEGKDFIVSGAVIDYLRQPSRLSLKEGLSCELAAHTHQEINDLAVEYLQLSTGNPLYQAKVSDNVNRA